MAQCCWFQSFPTNRLEYQRHFRRMLDFVMSFLSSRLMDARIETKLNGVSGGLAGTLWLQLVLDTVG